MESLIPFLLGSFIPYNMPVYPGARRVTGYSADYLANDGLAFALRACY